MIRSSIFLAAVLVAGLALGMTREILLISHWGPSHATDAFIIAIFLSEAIRTTLATGFVASAAIPLWLDCRDHGERAQWAASQTANLLVISIALAVVFSLLAPLWIGALGAGLSSAAGTEATVLFKILVWCLPGLFVHALLSLIHQADDRFTLPGMGSVLFNVPAVLYLLSIEGDSGSLEQLAQLMVLGSVLMPLPLLPHAWRCGWRPFCLAWSWASIIIFYKRITPLLLGASASQATILLERLLSSFLPEGSVTLMNLARKIIGLPAVAIASAGQVVFTQFSKARQSNPATADCTVLIPGLVWITVFTWPTALAIAIWAGAAAQLVLQTANAGMHIQLTALIQLFAPGFVFVGWNVILARYFYAAGDTKTPTRLEIAGTIVQIVGTLALFPWLQLWSLPLGALLGAITTWLLLFRRSPVAASFPKMSLYLGLITAASYFVWKILPIAAYAPLWVQLFEAGLFCTVCWILSWGILKCTIFMKKSL